MKYPFLATVWASLHRGYTLQSCSILGDLWYTQAVWPSASSALPCLPDYLVACSVLFNSPSNLGHTQFLHLPMILGTLSNSTLFFPLFYHPCGNLGYSQQTHTKKKIEVCCCWFLFCFCFFVIALGGLTVWFTFGELQYQ